MGVEVQFMIGCAFDILTDAIVDLTDWLILAAARHIKMSMKSADVLCGYQFNNKNFGVTWMGTIRPTRKKKDAVNSCFPPIFVDKAPGRVVDQDTLGHISNHIFRLIGRLSIPTVALVNTSIDSGCWTAYH
ncbi:hypothetical protein BDB01DRAFT_832331 [Pilobolus umbonatus]|nr:hypothetical protein BDB01DRAFT_832331 [Pilobolus umbonatus]